MSGMLSAVAGVLWISAANPQVPRNLPEPAGGRVSGRNLYINKKSIGLQKPDGWSSNKPINYSESINSSEVGL